MDLSMSQITYHSRRRDQPLNNGILFYGNSNNKNQSYSNNSDEQFSYGPIISNTKQQQQSQSNKISKRLYLQNISTDFSNSNNLNINNTLNQNIHNIGNTIGAVNMPSFSNLTTTENTYSFYQPLHSFRQQTKTKNSGINTIKNKQTHQQTVLQLKKNQQQQILMRQKIKTLTQHLKSALQANNEIQKRSNLLKNKLQQKQTKHMNQFSALKAELIITKNQLNQKDQIIKLKIQQIKQLQLKNTYIKQECQISKENHLIEFKKNQSQKIQIEQLKNSLIENEMKKNMQSDDLKKLLDKKDQQISQLRKQSQTIKQQGQSINKQLKDHINQLKQQLINNQNDNKSLQSENNQLKEQMQQQRNRINQLNENIREICQNSEHLFEQIIELKNKLKQNKEEKINLEQKLISLQKYYGEISIKYDDINVNYNLIQQQYHLLSQKHIKLQQQNIQINTNNTSLVQEIQLLNQQISQLKQICHTQQIKESQLKRTVHELKRTTSIMPTRDIQRRLHTQSEAINNNKANTSFNTVRTTRNDFNTVKTTTRNDYNQPSFNSMNNNHQQQQPRFNYLDSNNDQKPSSSSSRINDLTRINQPYSHLLSFDISKNNKTNNNNNNNITKNNNKKLNNSLHDIMYNQTKRRVSTCFDDKESIYCDLPLNKDYDLPYRPSVINNDKNDRRSKSFYIERNNSNNNDLLISQQQRNQVYKSVIDTKNVLIRQKQKKLSSSIKSMRHSFDFRERSLDSRKNSQQNTTRQQSISQLNNPYRNNIQIDKIYSQNIPQDSNQAKNMFLNKLDKMKLWAKQTVSQNNTERQALRDISQQQLKTNNDYLNISRDTSVQTIIKQKSSLLNQRKNLLTFNLNNQMIQKNILKLQKTNNNTQSKGVLKTRQDLSLKQNNNNISLLSPIHEQISNKKQQKDQKLTSTIYQNCKKMLYNHSQK